MTFNDYVQPNLALANRSIDANIFQHLPYLKAQAKANKLQLIPITKTFLYPMGAFSIKIRSLNELKNNALVTLPNDPSNCSRALLLLESAGLIKLKPNAGVLASLDDIKSNPHQLRFKLLDAAQLPRTLDDTDLAVINNDFILPSGLSLEQAIIKEKTDSLYANIITIRTEDKNNSAMQKLIKVMHSKAIIDKTTAIFPNGAAIPAWQNDESS